MTLARVFVSGGAGAIGRELVAALEARGTTVLVGDLKPRPLEFGPAVRYRRGDLNTLTQAELDDFAPDAFMHLAATFERSVESEEFWDENFHHNVALSHHLIDLARKCSSLRRVVFASSYLVYDPALYLHDNAPQTAVSLAEQSSLNPRNLTGMAKLSHESELQFLTGFPDCNFSAVSARIFRGYGRGSRDVISRWVRSLLAGEAIQVFCPEGQFDYLFAADAAEGLLRLAEEPQASGVVNLGNGIARQVGEIVEILRRQFPEAQIEETSSPIPVEASRADTELLRRLLNWTPPTTLEKGIELIIAHERQRSEHCESAPFPVPGVLITSASRKAPLVNALREAAVRVHCGARVVAADSDPLAPAGLVADGFWEMPRLEDNSSDAIMRGCLERGINIVFPTRDGELEFWSKHRADFAKAGITVVVSGTEAVRRCQDKLAFATFGSSAGLPFIPAAETPEALTATRYVVKERFGSGSTGIGIDLDLESALRHARDLSMPIFQPYVNGPEISIDGWLDQSGRCPGVVLRYRDRVVSGESQVTTSFHDHTLEKQAIELLERLELRGPVVMQAIITDQGPAIIECNPRFGGASTLAIAAGLDLLYWSIAEALGAPFEACAPAFSGPVRQLRLPTDMVIHGPDL
jgi:carbamoyl-phosphate synthase large subunit